MEEFLRTYGLYQEYLLIDDYINTTEHYSSPFEFIGYSFDYYCEIEEATKTFEIELDKGTNEHYGKLPGNEIPDEYFEDDKLNYTFKVIAKCRSCKKFHVDFFLNVYSDKPISNILNNFNNIAFSTRNTANYEDTRIFVQKVGALPEIKELPSKLITKYFDRESNNWYYKGINSIANKFGVGSFAYFRRIIEKELIRIIEDIQSLPASHGKEIGELLEKHDSDSRISTIYENIFPHLPNSLKELGNNPIKLLYNQTSAGLHTFSEEECLKKAKTIRVLLDFVIKKINEEKSEIKDIRNIIKDLE
jgi:hypothetical protein